jgi:hypothetical protein
LIGWKRRGGPAESCRKGEELWNWSGWEILQNLYFEWIIKHRHYFSEVDSEVILIVSGKKKETCSKDKGLT